MIDSVANIWNFVNEEGLVGRLRMELKKETPPKAEPKQILLSAIWATSKLSSITQNEKEREWGKGAEQSEREQRVERERHRDREFSSPLFFFFGFGFWGVVI